MKRKARRLKYIVICMFLFAGCQKTYDPGEEPIEAVVETEAYDDTQITDDVQTTEEASMASEEEEWVWQNFNKKENKIHVTADELQGNILGYSLLRYAPSPDDHMYYERDMSYLVEEELVGNGIYISDYMCETEIFLGNILKELLAYRGAVSDEDKQYFTEYALRQIEDTDWEALDAEWEADLWTYDRYYSLHPISGGEGYQFSYYFYGEEGKTAKEETNLVEVSLYVNKDGKICEIEITIDTVPMEDNRIATSILMNGLYDDNYIEPVIWDGIPREEEMVWDFERYFRRFMNSDEIYEQENEELLQSGNASSSAEAVADIFLHVMENRGADVERYADQFGFETDFSNFAAADWGVLEENWTASEAYDCFFIDRIAFSGYVGFRYYFYPDFKAMGADEAMMVVIECNVGIEGGDICYNTVDIFPVTEETCREMRQKQEGIKTLVVEKGMAVSGEEKVAIPVIDRELQYIPISEFDTDALAAARSGRKVKEELWGFTDAAEVGTYLGEQFLQDFAKDQVEEGELYNLAVGRKGEKEEEKREYVAIDSALYLMDVFLDDGWKTDGQYDCFRINSNEAAGCLHLQYYFYPEIGGEEQTKARTMVVDMFLSEEGIEKMDINEFCGN